MRAAVVDRYGPPEVVQIREVPKPVPGTGEILVRVTATTVNSGDARMRGLNVPGGMKTMMRLALGWNGPRRKIGGFDASGVVEQVGDGVTRFRPGDRVTGSHGFKFGLHAEYALFEESDALVKTPEGLSDTDAVSMLFGASTARSFLSRAGLSKGQEVLINGASGAVGVNAIQLAKRAGAQVTAVCSAANAGLVRDLGADDVRAYDREDPFVAGKTFDIFMDNHGNAPFAKVRHLLKPGGKYLLVIGNLWQQMSASWTPQVVSSGPEKEAINGQVYEELLGMAARGELRPVIDTVFPLERIVDAHRLTDSGRKRGSAVVTIP